MATRIIICDDSSFAQKQLMRALPEDWQPTISYAADGKQCMDALTKGLADVLFLDLNMPVMDGYEVLSAIRRQHLNILVIVVSGDIQPEAYTRVMELGALAFIKKPVDKQEIHGILEQYGIYPESRISGLHHQINTEFFDGYREITNVALGQATDLLARVLNNFVRMPIPNVSMLEITELEMAIDQVMQNENMSAVCQGFIGGGIAGEAMLLFSESNYQDIAEMMNFDGELDEAAKIELLMDLTNILIGACLKGIAEQFDINLSLGHPSVLGRNASGKDILNPGERTWKQTLAIDMDISVENKDVHANLLLLFTEDSISRINQLLTYAAA